MQNFKANSKLTNDDVFGFELDSQSISTYGAGYIIPRDDTIAVIWYEIQNALNEQIRIEKNAIELLESETSVIAALK